jgi:DNA (cytosine-5)-methyltransferase 1
MPALPLTIAEYFAGIGLVHMGLRPHGWEVLFATDISPRKYELYQVFFPETAPFYILTDVFDIVPSHLPQTTLATCSFPCTDISLAGKMQGMVNGRHSGAFRGFLDILKAQDKTAPPLLLLENVPGWLHSGHDFPLTVRNLNALGYACDVFALNARHFVPQSRLRIFLVGVRCPGSPAAPERILARPRALLPPALRHAIQSNLHLSWYCHDLPAPPPLRSAGLSDLLEPLPEDDPRWWPPAKIQRHMNLLSPLHLSRIQTLLHQDYVTHRTFFRRERHGRQCVEIRNDDLAGCLRTVSGGSARQFLVQAGKGTLRMRALTPREYARLQGVPDTYPLPVPERQALSALGDAVCVPAVSWIAQHILTPLATGEPACHRGPIQPGLFTDGTD